MKRRTMAFGGLLMAVAITGYSVAGTYAKYISNFGMADEARIARWEFNGTGTDTKVVDLFKQSYQTAGADTVQSSQPGIKVVAPGTSGEYSYGFTGTAEVNYIVYGGMTIENEIILKDSEGNIVYDPIKFCIADDCTDTANWKTAAELNKTAAGLTTADTTTDVYPANSTYTGGGKIQWKWDFETSDVNNSNDTLLTKLAKDKTVKVTMTTTVEQTQKAATKTDARVDYATFTNVLPTADADDFKNNWGYEADKAEDVIFNVNKLSGTIYKHTDSSVANTKFEGKEATGYYYTVSIKATPGYYVEFSGASGKEKNYTIGSDGALSLIVTLNPEISGRKYFKYTVYTDNTKTTKVGDEQTIDYSDLVFQPVKK